jgi:hypothetical protein
LYCLFGMDKRPGMFNIACRVLTEKLVQEEVGVESR